MFRSEIYNVLSAGSIELISKIHSLRQHLALHAVARTNWRGPQALQRGIARDFAALRDTLPEISPICSWHNPTPELLGRFRGKRLIGGLLNTYASDFTDRVTYLSDSNRRHTAEDFLALLDPRKRPFLQFLIHPLYWIFPEVPVEDVFAQTWSHIVREREAGFLENRDYRRWFPRGMPDQVVRAFSTRWKRSVPKTPGRK